MNALTCAESKYCPVRRNITSTTLPLRISSIPEQPMVWVINWRILSIWSCFGRAMMSIPDVQKKRGGLHRSERWPYDISAIHLHAGRWTDGAREYASLEAIQDNYEKLVVSLDDFCLPSNEGIRHVRAWELHGLLWKGQKDGNIPITLTKSNVFPGFPAALGFTEERIWDMLWIFGS